MVKKKVSKKKIVNKTIKKSLKKKTGEKNTKKNYPTLNIRTEHEIAMDFATKAYRKFNDMVKSIILFGSTVKKTQTASSDIDIVLVIDDVSVHWDQELIAWYRTELDKLLSSNPYAKSIHINTIKLSTWWEDLLRGDPTLINIIRYGETLIDLGGFFEPMKYLLLKGKIKSTPEAIYSCLQRAPQHLMRSKAAELSAIEGIYWSMVDSAHAALIAANVSPPSPEHIPMQLQEAFVSQKKLDSKFIAWYREIFVLHKSISHGEISELKGVEIDEKRDRAEEFLKVMAQIVNELVI